MQYCVADVKTSDKNKRSIALVRDGPFFCASRLDIRFKKDLTINELVNFKIMELDKVFEALASKPRRQILAYLSKIELSTSDLAEKFGISAPAISRHLSVLENAGLVSSERRGQFVFYKLNSDNLVNTLTGYAFEVCPVGRPLKRESRAMAEKKKEKPA